MPFFPRPAEGEYAPYYGRYLQAVPEGDLPAILRAQEDEAERLFGRLDDAGAQHRYAPGKWSVKEVLGHVIDTERIFAYRLLCIARGDTTPLPGFDQDPYVAASEADARPLADLLEEFAAVRRSTLLLMHSLPADAPARMGTASGQPVSAQALAWMLAGHAQHHFTVLRTHYGLGNEL